MKKLLSISVLALLSACSSIPEELRVDDGAPLVAFADARGDANGTQGLTARWGGIIAKVDNLADKTRLEVVNFALRGSTRPKPANATEGRFLIYADGLLDPMIYKVGKSITAVGEVAAQEPGKIGEHDYSYPVLKASAVHLWKDVEQYNVDMISEPYWYTPSYWRYYPTPFHHRSVVITKRSDANTKPASNKVQKK